MKNNIKVLGSGSSGNCYSLEVNNEILLLDLGFSYSKTLEFIEFELEKIVGCLVTHEHKDHSKSIMDFMKNGVDVYATNGTFEELGIEGHRAKVVKSKEVYRVGGFTVMPFDVEHDASEPVGFLVSHKYMGNLLYITDTYFVKYKFKGINHMLIECNYSKEIIDERLKDMPFLRNRIVQSHFELENVKEFVKSTNLYDLQNLVLIHLSGMNSDEIVFKEEIEKEAGFPVSVAKKGLIIEL